MDDLQHDLERAESRARRYWFEDGLAEISGGIAFLLVAVYLALEEALRGTTLGAVVNVAFPVVIVVLALGGRRLIRFAKDRYVHPRTGYVAFRRPRHPRANAALAFAIGILLALLVTRARELQHWLPALEGLMFAAAFLYMGRRAQLLRFPLEGLACAVIGLALSLLRLDEHTGTALLFACLGVMFVVAGVVAFAAYLRQAPPPEQA